VHLAGKELDDPRGAAAENPGDTDAEVWCCDRNVSVAIAVPIADPGNGKPQDEYELLG